MSLDANKKSNGKAMVQTITKTKTTNILAISLVGMLGFSMFAFFWFNLLKFDAESSVDEVTQNVKVKPTLSELTQRLFTGSNGSSDKLDALLAERQSALLLAAQTNPDEAVKHIIDGPVVDKLPVEVKVKLEQKFTDEGTLELVHYDIDIDAGLTRTEAFLLKADNSRLRLHLSNVTKLENIANSIVKVSGYKIDDENVLLADSAQDDGTFVNAVEVLSQVAAVTTVERKVAVLMINFVNDTRQNQTASQVRGIVFTGSKSTNTYDQDASFGALKLVGKNQVDGDVFGWYTLPDTYNSSTQSCSSSYRSWSTAGRQMAIDAGNDLTGYNHFIYLFPPTGGCPGSGWAEVNADESWIHGSGFNFGIVTHEHGHNLGTWHASSYTCTDESGQRTAVSSTCTMGEYGDPFDVMGSAGSGRHFNAAHKHQINFLTSANVLDVSTDGTYTVYPIEQLQNSPQAIRIARDRNASGQATRNYWIDFRRPIGSFDNYSNSDPAVNGVMIRSARVPSGGSGTANTLLFDANPATTTFADAPLPVGQIFEDPIYGLRFETVQVRSDSADIRVTFIPATCVRGNPNITITNPSSIYGSSGQTLSYSANITNTDSPACPASVLTVTPTLPVGWSQTPNPYTVTLDPGKNSFVSLKVTSSTTAPIGTYNFTEVVTNTSTNLTGTASSNYIVTGPDVTGPTLAITSPANGSTLKGKTVKITASANDPSGVATITISINGAVQQTCSSSSICNFSWKFRSVASGQYTISAQAVDASANANSSNASITVTKR